MRVRTLSAACGAVLFLAAATAAADEWEDRFETADPATTRSLASIQTLSEEASILNLVNGLYLSEVQSKQVISLAKEAGELRDRAIREHAETVQSFERALVELKGCLVSGGTIPVELEQRVHSREAAVKEAKRKYYEGLRGVERRLCKVLRASQLDVIQQFNPCLIPPQELKDPVRVGQAQSPTQDMEDHLATIRNLPDRAWKPVAEALFEMFLGFEEKILGAFPRDERRTELERLLTLATEVRALDEEEFELRKGDFALDVIRPIREFQDKAQEFTSIHLRMEGGLSKPGKFLLNPRVVPLLEERLKQAVASASVDLDGIDPAESCDDCGRGSDAVSTRPVPKPGPEPKFAHFAEWLGLDTEQSETAREAIGRGQADLMVTLAAEREDGRNILKEFLQKLLAGREGPALAVLGETMPNSEQTYFERVVEIKSGVESILEECLDEEQFEKYRSSGIDLFKIKVGSLRWKD
ncbi:MAG: hypothetical protein HYY93_10955 [Planctomycetes bacterium]|nr:hypothetical protein [Planctomycetota bacterium]